jgi:hypothetical protein
VHPIPSHVHITQLGSCLLYGLIVLLSSTAAAAAELFPFRLYAW